MQDTAKKIAGELTQMGHPSTPANVSADHSSVLEGTGEVLNDAGDYIGTTMEEFGGGATHIRHVPGKKALSVLWEKARAIAKLKKKQTE